MEKKPYKNKMLKPNLKDKVLTDAIETDKSIGLLNKVDPDNKNIALLEQQRDEALKFVGKK